MTEWTAKTEIPLIAITCDHRGGRGAVDADDDTPNEYHCAACCPGACVGSSGEWGPCSMHPEGAAVALLEARPIHPQRQMTVSGWMHTEEHGRAIIIHPHLNRFGARFPPDLILSVEDAEMLAIDILQSIGAARRGGQ